MTATMAETMRARPMLTPKAMPIFLLAVLVVAAAIVRFACEVFAGEVFAGEVFAGEVFAGEVTCGEVMVTVVSAEGMMLLLLDITFVGFGKRSKFSSRVELEPVGGCWIQASFKACRSASLYIRDLRVKDLEWFVIDSQLLNPDADGKVFKHPRQAL